MKQEQAETEGASSVTQTPKRMFGSKMRHENSECSRIHPKASIKILKDRVQEKSTLDLQEWR